MNRTLLRAGAVVTLPQSLGATDILIDDGVIVELAPAVGALAEAAARAQARPLDWSQMAVTPGTVNTHNHSFQSLLRGIGDDLPFLQWRERALYRYSPLLDAEGMETAALFAFGEMLLHGVTTVCDFYYVNRGGNDNALATIRGARSVGIRMVLARCFYDWDGAPTAYRETVAQAEANFRELYRACHDTTRALVQIHAAPHSQHGATPAMIEAGAGAAKDLGVPWHIHLAEESYQVDESLKRFGKRPIHAVMDLDVDPANMIAVHGCWFDAEERAGLANAGAALAYCPGSNMFLGDGVTDLVDLCARGVRVGLGTDGGCSNNRVSVFDEMRMAALLQKVHRVDGQAIDAETCFALGTSTAADVLRLPVGRLAPGYRADIVALDMDDPSLWPIQALTKNIVYALSPRAIRHVMVDGAEVVRDGQLTQVSLREIQARVKALTGEWTR